MTLVMSGHQSRTVSYVTEAKLNDMEQGQKKGYFSCVMKSDTVGNNLVVKFVMKAFINIALDSNQKQEALKHEDHHFNDYKALAEQMKKDVTDVLKKGGDPKMEDRFAWFVYDGCVKSRNFHARTVGYSSQMCSTPISSRPT